MNFKYVIHDRAPLTKENILDRIIECGKILDEQSIPDDNRGMKVNTHCRGVITLWGMHYKENAPHLPGCFKI